MKYAHPVPAVPPWLWGTLDLYEQLRLMRLTQEAEPRVQKHCVNPGYATTGTGQTFFFRSV